MTTLVLEPIRIGYQTVNVEYHGPEKLTDNNGQYFADESLIGIRHNLAGHHLAVTVLHEVMHAVWFTQAIRTDNLEDVEEDEDDLEEVVVNSMSNGFGQVFRDNPHLVFFLQDKLSQ